VTLIDDDSIRHRVKAEMRKRIRGLRATAPLDACKKRSLAIIERLEAHDVIKSATSVALFWPIEARHEVDLRDFDLSLRARGVRVAYPSIDPETREMTFRFVDDVTTLDERGLGFAEPSFDAPLCGPSDLTVIIVPAIAIAPTGHRIGYGAGFYDRALPDFAPPAITIGVAYDYQLVAEVPTTEGDVALDWIATDTRILRAEK
jgi:5-formyltetrahydrofolate cyclo-ligase